VFQIRISRLRLTLVAMTASLVIGMAACAAEVDETTTPSTNATPTQSQSTSPTSTPRAGGASPTSQASPDTGAIDCGTIGNLGIPGTTLQTEGSEEPTSQFAEDISAYFEEAIDKALSDATATCYLEGAVGDNSGLWVSFKLDEALPPNASELLRAELESQGEPGVTVRAMSVNILGNEFAAVTVTGAEVLGQYSGSGATLFMTPAGVVLVAGTTANNPAPQ
jgi:hypothetical protein